MKFLLRLLIVAAVALAVTVAPVQAAGSKTKKEQKPGVAAYNSGVKLMKKGKYAEALASTGAEADAVDRSTPAVSFVERDTPLVEGGTAGSGSEGPLLGAAARPAGLARSRQSSLCTVSRVTDVARVACRSAAGWPSGASSACGRTSRGMAGPKGRSRTRRRRACTTT